MSTRREAISLIAAAIASTPFATAGNLLAGSGRRLFFDEADVPRIRANAEAPLLRATFEAWRSVDAAKVEAAITSVLDSGDLLTEWGRAIEEIYRQAMLLLLTGDAKHRDLTMIGLRTLRELDQWDYMREAGTKVLGLMRASKATTATLFSLEVLGDEVPANLRVALMQDVADKGCEPCHLTIYQMDHPEEAVGWGVDDVQRHVVTRDMSRWPWILAVNNLRAIPTMGLGLGALALAGQDERAEDWLDAAVSSSRTFLGLFEPDGSYEEGISYVDFAFRTLFLFLEAHYRIQGNIDWVGEIDFAGVTEYIVCLQNGRNAAGEPDIINISDSRNSVFTCVPSWIANRSGSELAAYAAQHFARPGYFADFLWYRPERAGSPPAAGLLNKKFDLDWIVCRTGWGPDDTVLSFRSGAPSNHEHADRNTILLKARGERLLTEHFGASYSVSEPHWLLRLPEAHNAVLVDGKGHQYHNGEEGTNASQASAAIVRYVDHGDTVHWTSDATPAYRLVDQRITFVRRSVIFRKPDLVILIDEVEAVEPVTCQILFHPDNRDGEAKLDVYTGGEFGITRPNARLAGRCYSNLQFIMEQKRLDLPPDQGVFPYLAAATHAGRTIRVLTTLEVSHERPAVISSTDAGWQIQDAGAASMEVSFGNGLPDIRIR